MRRGNVEAIRYPKKTKRDSWEDNAKYMAKNRGLEEGISYIKKSTPLQFHRDLIERAIKFVESL